MNHHFTPPLWLKAITSPFLTWEFPSPDKSIFLTFDDGPSPDVTPRVLDLLDKFDARATFFVTGKNVEENPDLFNDIIKRGHSVGNHTWSHPDGWKTSAGNYIDQVKRCSGLVKSDIFRPPYGRLGPLQWVKIRKEGLRIMMWSVLSGDYRQDLQAESLLSETLKHTRAGSIVVFHDTPRAAENCLYLLKRLLEKFSEDGFTFKAIH